MERAEREGQYPSEDRRKTPFLGGLWASRLVRRLNLWLAYYFPAEEPRKKS